jgi:hypothetical protein
MAALWGQPCTQRGSHMGLGMMLDAVVVLVRRDDLLFVWGWMRCARGLGCIYQWQLPSGHAVIRACSFHTGWSECPVTCWQACQVCSTITHCESHHGGCVTPNTGLGRCRLVCKQLHPVLVPGCRTKQAGASIAAQLLPAANAVSAVAACLSCAGWPNAFTPLTPDRVSLEPAHVADVAIEPGLMCVLRGTVHWCCP